MLLRIRIPLLALVLLPAMAAVGLAEVPEVVQAIRFRDAEVAPYLEKYRSPLMPHPLPPPDQLVAAAAEMIEKGIPSEGEQAAWMLGDWGSAKSIEPLLKACSQKDAGVRAQAAASLGRLDYVMTNADLRTVAERLGQLSGDTDQRVLAAAAASLGELRAFEQLAPLARHVASDNVELAVAVVRALGRTGRREAFDLFRAALDSPHTALVVAAIESVQQIGDGALAQQVAPKIQSPSLPERAAAVQAVVALKAVDLTPSLEKALRDPSGAVRREALKGLIKFGGAAHKAHYLAVMQDPDPSVRETAAGTVGRFKLLEGIRPAYELFADPEVRVRQQAADSLVAIANEDVIRLAAEGLYSRKETVRECSSQVLGRLRNASGFDQHVKLLTDPHLPARRWAAWGVGEIGRREAISRLVACAFEKPPAEVERIKQTGRTDLRVYPSDPEAAACAILSLGKLGHVEAAAELHAIIQDKPTEINPGAPGFMRDMSARALGLMKHRPSVAVLLQRLNNDDLIEECAVALARIGATEAVGALRKRDGYGSAGVACHWALTQLTAAEPLGPPPPAYPTPPKYFLRYMPPK